MDTVTDTGETFMDTLRENPIPAAMIGIGVGWLLMSRQRHERYGRADIYHRPFPDDFHARYEGAGGYADQGGGGLRERAGEVAETVQQRASDMADTLQERTGDLREQLEDGAGRAREGVRESYQWTADCVRRNSQDHPILMGLAALGIGAGVALLLPELIPERRAMGGTRDHVLDQAQRRIQEAGHRATAAAQEAMNTVQQSVQEKMAA